MSAHRNLDKASARFNELMVARGFRHGNIVDCNGTLIADGFGKNGEDRGVAKPLASGWLDAWGPYLDEKLVELADQVDRFFDKGDAS